MTLRTFLCFLSLALTVSAQSTRTWTDTDGRSLEGTVIHVDAAQATLRIRNKVYHWPLEKFIQADRDFLATWRTLYEAKRAERLAALVGSFENYPLTTRAYPNPKDYLQGELIEEYFKRVVPQYGKDNLAGLDYDVAEHTAALYVPSAYDESRPFGVYVEVTAGKRGRLPDSTLQKIFAKHHLIYICPHGAGNQAILGYRMGLALDALATLEEAYQIDDKHCYIGGVSGGGISATLINYLRPEHFRGAVNCVRGALLEPYTLEKDILISGDKGYPAGQSFPPFLPHLKNKHARLSQHYHDKRWAFVSGEKDYNYEFAQASATQWKTHGYQAKYFHVPGLAHQAPPAHTLDEILTWMAQ